MWDTWPYLLSSCLQPCCETPSSFLPAYSATSTCSVAQSLRPGPGHRWAPSSSSTRSASPPRSRSTPPGAREAVALLAVDLVLLYTVPAILGTLLKAALGGDWDDPEKLKRRLIADQLNYLLGTVVLVREANSAVQSALGLQGDYAGPASVRFFADLAKFTKQWSQGDLDEGFWKALNNVTGTLLHYPSGQINATIDGIDAIARGRTQNPGALLVGSNKN